MATFLNWVSKPILWCDFYTDQPKLLTNSFRRFTSCYGTLMTVILAIICVLLYAPVANRYINNDYIAQQSFGLGSYITIQQGQLVTGRDIYMCMTARLRNTSQEVDITEALNTFMKLTLINVDNTNSSSPIRYHYPTEPAPTNYLVGFQNGESLQYCYKPLDKLNLTIWGSNKYLTFLFEADCKSGAKCNGQTMLDTNAAFQSYFITNTFTCYFTTRYLDDHNNVKFQVNQASGFEFLQNTGVANQVQVLLTDDYYYIDDSILPNRVNRTFHLESYEDRLLVNSLPSSIVAEYGVGAIILQQLAIKNIFRYFTKLDQVIGLIGGGMYLFYQIIALVGYRLNRYYYRQRIAKLLYLCQVNGTTQLAQLTNLQSIAFVFYNEFIQNDPMDWPDENRIAGKLFNYRQVFQRTIHKDTNIVDMIKKTETLKRIMKMQAISWNNFKETLRPASVTLNDDIGQIGDKDQELIYLMDWNQNNFADYKIMQRDLQTNDRNAQIKKRQLTQTDGYRLAYAEVQKRKEQLTKQLSRQVNKPKSCWPTLKSTLQFIDAFKVSPRFTWGNKQKSFLVGFLVIIELFLCALMMYNTVIYFLKSTTRISSEVNFIPLNNINYTVNVEKSIFSMALCFLDSLGEVQNMESSFNTYATIELVQYERHGNEPYEQFNTTLQPMMDPLKYFNDDGTSLTRDYGNCYAIPLGSNVSIQGSPTSQDERYFSIRVKQQCHITNQTTCAANLAADRANTLAIFSGMPMIVVLSRSQYNPRNNSLDVTFTKQSLFRQRLTTGLNTSVYQQVEVDEMAIFDDKSISREPPKLVQQSITTQLFYGPMAVVLQPDNNSVSYEIALRPSGIQQKVTIIAIKADEMFGRIGGNVLVIFLIFGVFLHSYSQFLQRIIIASSAYKKDKYKLNYCDIIRFYVSLPFKSRIPNNGDLSYVKQLDAASEESFSIEVMIQRRRTCYRFIKQMQRNPFEKEITQLYIKTLNDIDISPQVSSMSQVHNHFGNEGIIGQQEIIANVSSYQQANLQMGQIKMDKDCKQQSINGQIVNIKTNRNVGQNNSLLYSDLNSSIKEKDDIYPEVSCSETNLKSKGVPLNQHKQRNNWSNLFSHQNFISRYTDIFGVEGQMTVDGSAPYGSVCGGIFTILCSILIGASIYYLVQLYNSDHNYIGTFEYTRVLETNGQIFQQNFSTGINLRMAVGSISGRLPGIQNVSSTFTGSNQVLGVIGVQAQIDRTTPTHPIYTQQVYNFQQCPPNYLNDGNTFVYEDFGYPENISLAYCIPENVHFQFYGNPDTPYQRWFYVSVAMICPNCTTPQITSQRSLANIFFTNYSSRMYLSDPIVDQAPFRYDFQRLIFGKASTSRNTVENVSIDSVEFIEDKYLLQPPDVFNTMDYIYSVNDDANYYYSDSAHLFKNLTFTPTQNRSRYVRTYIKIDQIFGTLGGFALFVIWLFGFFARRHNKFKMRMAIGEHLLLNKNSGANRDSEPYVPLNVCDSQVFKFFIFWYVYRYCNKWINCTRYTSIKKLEENVNQKLDLLFHLQTLNCYRDSLANKLELTDKGILDLPVKQMVHNIKAAELENIQAVNKAAQLFQLSPYEVEIIRKYLQCDDANITGRFGQTAEYWRSLKNKEAMRIRNRPRTLPNLQQK